MANAQKSCQEEKERDEAEDDKEKEKKKRKKKANRTFFYFSCFFSTNFRRLTNRVAEQEDADKCDEEDANPIRVRRRRRRRQERKVVDGRRKRKKDERWRSATGRQNLLDRREALQM